jgi:putative secretion ATPase (PEP-CTERM system associated)
MFDDFYGLTGKPFQLTPDPAFYFRSVTHRKALSYLGYGLAQGEGFIVITGEVGAGKSTLVAHLMGTVDPSRLTVGQIVTSKLDEDEIIHVVAQSFGLDIEGHDKAGALGAIEGFLHEEARAGRRCLLVIDESQNLAVEALEELRMLSNFQLGNHPLLQTLLLGQPEFRATLQNHTALEQLRQRVIAAHHLEPMEKGEIEPYIVHRLEKVGWNGNPQFDQRVFTELYEATGGIPRRVNQVANRLLLLGAVEERSRVDSAMLKSVLDELDSERAFPQAAPQPLPRQEPAFEPVAPLRHGPAIDAELIDELLAERDTQIAELQQAIVELSNQQDAAAAAAVRPELEAMQDQVVKLEAKLLEQERTMRQTLTMLIEWIEGEMEQTRAA